ncbi:hypothetical protein Tsubulata_015073 [Turnera subulata]|uniref:Uncharacterized protein n=1 Tax=Turnera subulata TaxID=218843 RepID=A0A9Q0G7J6_9ROSI|nr:hypothetical protein Tsubulata_015073 [Turnera subulata]
MKAAAGRARRRWGRGARPVAAAAVVAACRVLARRRGDAGAGRDVASPVRSQQAASYLAPLETRIDI